MRDYLNAAHRGSMNELIAAAYFLRLGCHVFLSATKASPCDLVVMDAQHRFYRVEVKSKKNRRPSIKDKFKHDWLALVDTNGTVKVTLYQGVPASGIP